MTGKKILVTGGAGFVGSHCVKLLHETGFDCVVFDNLSSGSRDFVRWTPLIEGDIRDGEELDRVFTAHDIAAVVHFAALSSVAESMSHPGRYYDVNVHGTRTLLEAMVRGGVGALVFSSSCALYGEPEKLPIVEQTPLLPVNPYGMSKLVCERMMDDYGRAHGLRSVRLRYFNAAGADPNGAIGEDHERESRLIPLAMDAVQGRRSQLQLTGTDFDTPDGTAIRDYIHVADLADGHVRAIRYLLDGGVTTSLNLGTGSGSSVKEVLTAIHQVAGREVPMQMAPRRPGDPPVLVADAAKAQSVLGWMPVRSDLKTIVADAWNWHQKRFH